MRSWTLSALIFYSNKIYYKIPPDYVALNLEAIHLYGRLYLNYQIKLLYVVSDTLTILH